MKKPHETAVLLMIEGSHGPHCTAEAFWSVSRQEQIVGQGVLLTPDVVVDAVAKVPPSAVPRKLNSRELVDMVGKNVVQEDASLISGHGSIYAIHDCAPRMTFFAVAKGPYRMSDRP